MTTPTLKVSQVSELLQCDPRTVHGLIRRGELRALKVGRVLRVPEDAIDGLEVVPRAEKSPATE